MRRLYNAACAWLEASEMHAGYGRGSIDDDDGGAYRAGFQRNEQKPQQRKR